ncbi:MAG: magnesium transporter [Alphaproteobacteria bacterium]
MAVDENPADRVDVDAAPPQGADDAEGVTSEFVSEVAGHIDDGDAQWLRESVSDMWPADIADLFEALDPSRRDSLVATVKDVVDPETFAEIDEDLREAILEQLEPHELVAAVGALETDDAIEVVADLDEDEREAVLARLPEADSVLIRRGLEFAEYTAGRLMQRDLLAIPAFWTVGDAIDFMRSSTELPDDFYDIFIVDPRHRPLGALPLSRLLRSRRGVYVQDIMSTDVTPVPADMDQETLANMFRRQDIVSAPVVDGSGKVIGVVTIDDIVDVIDEEHEEDVMRLGGLSGDDLYRAAFQTTKSRFPWLMVNLFTAVMASLVIAQFDATIQEIVALAVLMPIVASMGGNAGTQTLTVVVRALATRELSRGNAMRLIGKELIVGLANGVAFAAVAGLMAWAWFGDPMLGGVIAAAMVVNLISAGLFGAAIPVVLERLKVDPAIASTVILTTVTDVVGFFAFLGLAAAVLI